MLRINQFAKEIGVTNHDVIDAMEKRLNIPGKSHSSNLSDDQISQLRRIFDAKSKGNEEAAPLGLHKATAAVKIVKAAPFTPGQAPSVLVKRPEPTAPEPQAAPESAAPAQDAPAPPTAGPLKCCRPTATPTPASAWTASSNPCRQPCFSSCHATVEGRAPAGDQRPKTLARMALPVCSGLARMRFSSSATIRNRPSSARVVTYCCTLASSPFTSPKPAALAATAL